MAQNVDQKLRNRLARPSAPPHSTGAANDVSDAQPSAEPSVPVADDLPDIIDLVMEMSRVPEEAPADAQALRYGSGRSSPPPLPVVSKPRLPAHLDALADRVSADRKS